MTEPFLVVENVSKRFAGPIALESVSIDVARASMTGVIGPNGSGKSTLFNIIAGTLRPDSGRVIVAGRDITRASPAEICGCGVARTFQISRLFAEMTVLENLVAVARGRDDRAAIDLAMELLGFLEITGIADKWASGAFMGSASWLRSAGLMLQPKILLLDEPFAGINPRLQNRIVEHLHTLCARGITVFFIDHEMRRPGRVTFVYVLAEGRLISSGDTQTVRNDAKSAEAYFRTMGDNESAKGRK
jgi:branched-chain amino acid transport system ATP-binding protein